MLFSDIHPAQAQTIVYHREAALQWARANNPDNNQYRGSTLGRWCTNYVAGALAEGGLNVSPSWSGNSQLVNWMKANPHLWEFRPLNALIAGDFVLYSDHLQLLTDYTWTSATAYNPFGHSALVTAPNRRSQWNNEKWDEPLSMGWPVQLGVHIRTADDGILSANGLRWDFRQDMQNWTIGNGLTGPTAQGIGQGFNVVASDPYLLSPTMSGAAASFPTLFIRMASKTDPFGQVFFKRSTDTAFAESRSTAFTIDSDGGTHSYFVNMAANLNWNGTITQLRLDPAAQPVQNQVIRIDEAALLSKVTAWDFSKGLQGWTVSNGLGSPTQLTSGLWFAVQAADPQLISPMVNIPTASYRYAYITMASQTDSCGEIYFRKAENPDFVAAQHERLLPKPDGTTYTYVIDLANDPNWNGTVIQFRLDPACEAVKNRAIRLDKIVLSNTPPAAPTAAPILAAPVNGGLVNTLVPTLTWNAVVGAQSYYVQVDDSATMTSPEQIAQVMDGVTYYTSNLLTDGKTYYWRVRALNSAAGPWSAVRSFKVDVSGLTQAPLLLAPAHETTVISARPIFSWKSVGGAAKYELWYDTDSLFTTASKMTVTTASFTPPAALLTATYFWRVRALDSAGNSSPWSDTRTVYVAPPSGTALLLNRFTTRTPTLAWSKGAWAVQYEIQIDNQSTFTSLDYSLITIDTSVTVPTLPDGVWYWRVRGQDSEGTWKLWNTSSFVIDLSSN